MKLRGALVVFLLAGAATAAGCLSPATDQDAVTAPPPAEVSNLTALVPKVDAQLVYDQLKTFSEAFPKRNVNNDAHAGAREWLAKEMEAAGLEVILQEFENSNSPVASPSGLLGAYKGVNVIGIKWGSDRDNWIVVGAHYDVTDGALYGAYDDGSGTVMTIELAKAFAALNTTRTIAFVPFDMEEQGLVGSDYFYKSIAEGSFTYEANLTAMIDLDMIGINWPADPAIICWQNSPDLKALTEDLRKAAGVPDTHMKYREPSLGSSDGAVFIGNGVPTVYFWSNWDEMRYEGQDVPGTYPFWHQADTVEGMDTLAGGHDKLLAGMQVDLDVVSGILTRLAMDATFVPTAEL